MQSRKLVVAVLALLAVSLFANSIIPRGHADDNNETITVTGYTVRDFSDTFYGQTVNGIQAGNVLTFTVLFVADNQNYQRNITMGVKFDWMTSFQNTTTSTPVLRGQSAYITFPFTLPALTGQYASLNQTPHSWTVEVWDMAIGAVWTNSCFDMGITSCRQFNSNFAPLAIYSSTQVTCVLTEQQAAAEISALADILSTTKQSPPGTNSAVASLALAEQQLILGQDAYQTGNFNQAQTNFQNALNSANAAQNSLATTGGGTDTASLTSIWLVAVAGLLGGLGALLLGLGGFNYLRKRAAVPKVAS